MERKKERKKNYTPRLPKRHTHTPRVHGGKKYRQRESLKLLFYCVLMVYRFTSCIKQKRPRCWESRGVTPPYVGTKSFRFLGVVRWTKPHHGATSVLLGPVPGRGDTQRSKTRRPTLLGSGEKEENKTNLSDG